MTQGIFLGTHLDTDEPFYISNQRLATKKGFLIGQSEAGKTWAAAVVVEGMMDLGITVVVFDLIDMWSGLALDREGKRQQYPIAIFGGKRGHYRLSADMGNAIARTVYSKRWSTVVNLSGMLEKDQFRIASDIVRKTMQLHEDQPRRTVFVFEEAHRFIPETLTSVENHALVSQEITRASDMGRNVGIGMLGITLRPQEIKKRILGQADWALWMKMNETGAIDAARKWLLNATDADAAKDYAARLSSLETGTGIFGSPSWMKTVAPVRVGMRKTFHRDPESDFVMDDAMIAQAVDVAELRRVFSGFQVEPENDTDEMPAAAPVKTKSAAAKTHDRAADTELRHSLRETQSELAAIRTAFDELKEANGALEADVAQRIRLAEEAATREAAAQLGQIKSVLAQVIAQLQPLVAADSADGTFIAAPAPAPIAKVKRLEQQVEEHPRIKSAGKKIIRTLVAEYPDFPNGLPRAKLASYARLTAGGGTWSEAISDLKARRYIVVTGQGDGALIALNPKML